MNEDMAMEDALFPEIDLDPPCPFDYDEYNSPQCDWDDASQDYWED